MDSRTVVNLGEQRFDSLIQENKFYIDKTGFIKEWWECGSKVHKPSREKDLAQTVANALAQIEEKQYAQKLVAEGIAPERIKKYGFAFRGKECLIG